MSEHRYGGRYRIGDLCEELFADHPHWRVTDDLASIVPRAKRTRVRLTETADGVELYLPESLEGEEESAYDTIKRHDPDSRRLGTRWRRTIHRLTYRR